MSLERLICASFDADTLEMLGKMMVKISSLVREEKGVEKRLEQGKSGSEILPSQCGSELKLASGAISICNF